MNDFERDEFKVKENSSFNGSEVTGININEFMVKVYGWMFFGLIVTAMVSYFTITSSLSYLALNPIAYLVLVFAELGLVWYLSSRVFKMSFGNAATMFIVYSGLNGLTLSIIFFRYTSSSIASTFVIAALFFGVMSIYGLVTKQDLTKWGQLLMAALIGIIISSIVNVLIFKSDSFSLFISFIGVAVFLGLTAYDTKKIKEIYYAYKGSDKEKNIAILGSLTLYLDFINLFLFMLRILGRRR